MSRRTNMSVSDLTAISSVRSVRKPIFTAKLGFDRGKMPLLRERLICSRLPRTVVDNLVLPLHSESMLQRQLFTFLISDQCFTIPVVDPASVQLPRCLAVLGDVAAGFVIQLIDFKLRLLRLLT